MNRSSRRTGRTLPIVSAAAVALAGSGLAGVPGMASAVEVDTPVRAASTGLATFTYTGGPQDWPIPRGVTSAYVTLIGGAGGVGSQVLAYRPKPPAQAAQVQGTLTWLAGTFALDLWVGGTGGDVTGVNPEQPSPGTPGAGGWNGGAAGGTGSEMSVSGGGGGGATDIRIGGYLPDTRVMVAGGGGGQGGIDPGQSDPEGQGLGGTGGVGTATAGVWAGGDGGTAQGDNGGRGGSGGWNPGGQATSGGDAGTATGNGGGGGGGGGWFGGEGGGAGRAGLIGDSGPGGGGGGGSSYAEPGLVSNTTATLASLTDPPQAQIAWVDLSATTMPDLVVGATVQQQLAAAFGVPNAPLSWTVTGGRLPDGVSLSSSGVLTGIPTRTGSYEFTVTVSAQPGNLATSTTTLRGTVRQGGPAPSAPTAVTATGGVSSASVTWAAPVYPGTSPITTYQVRWSSDAGQSWSPPVTVPATQTAYTASLGGGASYVFQVAAVNASGPGPWSASSNAVAVTSSSTAPANVTGVAGYESVALSWQAPTQTGGTPVTGYFIRYSTDGGGSWAQLPNTGSTATTATVTGLTSQAGYIFEVAAINAVGVSPWSSASSVIDPLLDPGAPSDVVGVAAYQAVELTWLAPPASPVPVTGYVVRYSDDSGATWSTPVSTGSTATTYDYTGLAQPDFLVFQVAATNATGTSAWSAPSAPVSPETRPSAPTRLKATAEDRAVTLSWDPPADLAGGTLSGYRIDIRTEATAPWRVHTASTGTGATRYRVDPLVNGIAYEFRVAAITQFGVGLFSKTVTSRPYGTPGMPTGVRATAGNASATITWDAPASDNGRSIIGYRIEASSESGWYLVSADTRSSATSFTATGLVNGATYLFRVAAITIGGAGPESVPSNAVTPSATPPSPPRFVAVRPGEGRAEIVWQPPTRPGAAPVRRYVVQASVAGGPWATQCETRITSCLVRGLSAALPYRFRVAAVSDAGQGRWSGPTAAVLPGIAPSRPVVTGVRIDGDRVSVQAVPGSLGRVRLEYWNSLAGWVALRDGLADLPRGVAEASIRAVHAGRVSPTVRVSVDRGRDRPMTLAVVIDGDASSITGAPGTALRWRYASDGAWQPVTSPLTLRPPAPPARWALQVRSAAASVTIRIA